MSTAWLMLAQLNDMEAARLYGTMGVRQVLFAVLRIAEHDHAALPSLSCLCVCLLLAGDRDGDRSHNRGALHCSPLLACLLLVTVALF